MCIRFFIQGLRFPLIGITFGLLMLSLNSHAELRCAGTATSNVNISTCSFVMIMHDDGLFGLLDDDADKALVNNGSTINNNTTGGIGIENLSLIKSLSNSGTIYGTSQGIKNAPVPYSSGYVGGRIDANTASSAIINNTGAVINSATGNAIDNSYYLATINSYFHALVNYGYIGFDPSRPASLSGIGIQNFGHITSASEAAIYNASSGSIFGSVYAIYNDPAGIADSANISGYSYGILNQGVIGHINPTNFGYSGYGNVQALVGVANFGTISSSAGSAIHNTGSILGSAKAIDNSSIISGLTSGISNQGNIGFRDGDSSSTAINNSGTIISANGVAIDNFTNANLFGYNNTIENSGSISGALHAIRNDGSIGYVTGNYGAIGIQNFGNISSNSGSGIQNTSNGRIFGTDQGIYNMSLATIEGQTYAISNDSVIGSAGAFLSQEGIRNEGTIRGINGTAIYNASNGIITGYSYGILNTLGATIEGNIQNLGTIKNIKNEGSLNGSIINSGSIETIDVSNNYILGSIYNSGQLNSLYLGGNRLFITGNNASIGSLSYTGMANINIGIDQNTTANFTPSWSNQFYNLGAPTNFNINAGSTLNSFSGISSVASVDFTNNGTLSVNAGDQLNLYLGASPANKYIQTGQIDIGINNASAGQLVIRGNAMINGTIGIQSGSIVNEGTYSSVIKINPTYGGVTDKTLVAATPYYVSNRRKYSYEAVLNTSDAMFPVSFDLLLRDIGPAGPATEDTQAAIKNTVARLRGAFNVASIVSGFANMNTYDCNLFDKNNMCISAGGRHTNVDNPNNNVTSAVVVLGYKASPNIRIGGFLDQSLNHTTPQGLHISNKNPMMGAFAIWNQSQNGLGFQMKLANTYQDQDISTVRDVIGTSEAGRGNTNLNIQSYLAELSYAFNHQDKLVVRPYFALRHTKIKQDAFTESGVDNPLSVAKLNDRALSSLLGAKFNFAMTPRLNLVGSVGVEQDLTRKVDQFVATSSNIEGLTPEAFNSNADRTRAVGSMGAYYAVQKNQRLSMDVFFQESTFGGRNSTTGYLNYMIGF